MSKIININPLIKPEDAEYFLRVYHDISLKENPNTKEIYKELSSVIGHFYVGFVAKDQDEVTLGKGPINLINGLIGLANIGHTEDRLAKAQKYSEKSNEQVVDIRIIPLTPDQYQKSYNFAKAQKESSGNLYIAGHKDCADFVQSVYHATGLSLHFTKCYTSSELQSFGTIAAGKALTQYSSRDKFPEYFRCIEGLSKEEIALRLNLPIERVEESFVNKLVGVADFSDGVLRHFSINIKASDLLLEERENIDEYFAAWHLYASDLAEANPFKNKEESNTEDDKNKAKGWDEACNVVSACHSDKMREELKNQSGDIHNFMPSANQMEQAKADVLDFFGSISSTRNNVAEFSDISSMLFPANYDEVKKQIAEDPWLKEMIATQQTMAGTVDQVRSGHIVENMPLNLGMQAPDFSQIMSDFQSSLFSLGQASDNPEAKVMDLAGLIQDMDLD